MTKYDYSPEAYEHFMATQNCFLQWANTTQLHPRDDRRDDRSHHAARDSRSSASSSGRPSPVRLLSAPSREDLHSQQYPQNSKHSSLQYSLLKPAQQSSLSSHQWSSPRPPSLQLQTCVVPPTQPQTGLHPVGSNSSPESFMSALLT